MLAIIKKALRIMSNAFDDELNALIAAAIADLKLCGIVGASVTVDSDDVLVQQAVTAFVKWRFGDNNNAERMKELYELQKAQLQTATNYTEWSG